MKEKSNFTDVRNLKSPSSLSSVRRQICTERCWCYPSLPPSSPHPPLLSEGGVSGGRMRRLLQWQQGPPPLMLHCSSTVTLRRNTVANSFNSFNFNWNETQKCYIVKRSNYKNKTQVLDLFLLISTLAFIRGRVSGHLMNFSWDFFLLRLLLLFCLRTWYVGVCIHYCEAIIHQCREKSAANISFK